MERNIYASKLNNFTLNKNGRAKSKDKVTYRKSIDYRQV